MLPEKGVCTGDPGPEKPLADYDSVSELDQELLLVTEYKSESNAGFVVLFGSDHTPIITQADWRSILVTKGEDCSRVICRLRDKVVEAYWQLVRTMVNNGRNDRHMSREACHAWVQTGLGLAPFCGHHMDSSLEWTVAWSFIGEWTSRELAAELSPCQNHMPYDQRSIPLHTWARTCFEQGSLPSLLALPGKAAMLMFPGEKNVPIPVCGTSGSRWPLQWWARGRTSIMGLQ